MSCTESQTGEEAEAVSALQDQAQILLREYAAQRHPHLPTRFGRLLLTLARVRCVTPHAVTAIFFRETVGNIPIDRLILDIFKNEMRKLDRMA